MMTVYQLMIIISLDNPYPILMGTFNSLGECEAAIQVLRTDKLAQATCIPQITAPTRGSPLIGPGR